MKITLVLPSIGRRPQDAESYVGSWQMEPLAMAALAGATPKGHDLVLADDRCEPIPYDDPTDLVAINTETFTARRAYQIAAAYKARGRTVVMGGFHASLVPDEAAEHADAVLVGEAEQVWPQMLADFAAGRLQKRYVANGRADLSAQRNDRSVFRGKRYMPITLIESGRGCNMRCNFCSVTEFFGNRYVRRPADNVIAEIEETGAKTVFFVDDNVVGNPKEARQFFESLIPLGIKWVSQCTIDVARDEALLDVLVESGCMGLLIGFESLNEANLARMNKKFNKAGDLYAEPLANLAARGIKLYSCFLLGYDEDDTSVFQRTIDFCLEHKFFIVAFNHCVPFPGTPLYTELEREGRLRYPKWWLDDRYRFGGVAYHPKKMTAVELEEGCMWCRHVYYGWPSILRRAWDFQTNVRSFSDAVMFFSLNRMLQREVDQKRGLPLGFDDGGLRGVGEAAAAP